MKTSPHASRVSRANGSEDRHAARSNPAFITGTRQGRSGRSRALPLERDRPATHPGGVGSRPDQGSVRPIDPQLIIPSPWANRHPDSYMHQDFLDLKLQIATAGGNDVPIKVRPIPRASRQIASAAFEVVWGHRRHRACFELDVPVLAHVEAVSDQQLVAQMHAENRSRQDLSAFERGRAYDQMIVGLYPSQVVLAKRLGVDVGDVSRLRFLGTLSPDILAIMQSPLDLAIHDADKLRPALAEHRDEVLRRVSEIAESEGSLPTKQVIRRLSDFAPKAAASSLEGVRSIEIDGQRFGHIKLGADRHPDVKLTVPLSARNVDALDKVMRGFLRKVLGTANSK